MFVGIGVGIGRQRFAGGGGFADDYFNRVTADGGTIEVLTCVANASTLLQQASLLLIPSGYKAGVAYSALPNNGNGDLTWTRNSTANRTNSSGLIESVGANVPRLDYTYGTCPSALLEPQRTNLCLYSQDFNGSGWTFLGSTKVSTTQTDPSGGNTALNVTWVSGGGGYFYRNQTGLTIGATYTITFYVRSTNNSTFRLYSESLAFSSANFTATSTFQRFTLSYTANQTSGTFGLRSATTNASADLIVAFAQFEVGSYATTYIPTTTASATRITDTFTRNNIYTNGLISASGGTWYVELKNNIVYTRDISTFSFFIGDTTSGTTNSIVVRNQNTTARLSIARFISGAFGILYNTTSDNVKLAIKWNGLTLDIFANGVKVVNGSVFTPTLMEFLATTTGTRDVPIFIQAMALYNTPLSDSDCITLTT